MMRFGDSSTTKPLTHVYQCGSIEKEKLIVQSYSINPILKHNGYTANVLSAEFTDECLRTKSKDNKQ